MLMENEKEASSMGVGRMLACVVIGIGLVLTGYGAYAGKQAAQKPVAEGPFEANLIFAVAMGFLMVGLIMLVLDPPMKRLSLVTRIVGVVLAALIGFGYLPASRAYLSSVQCDYKCQKSKIDYGVWVPSFIERFANEDPVFLDFGQVEFPVVYEGKQLIMRQFKKDNRFSHFNGEGDCGALSLLEKSQDAEMCSVIGESAESGDTLYASQITIEDEIERYGSIYIETSNGLIVTLAAGTEGDTLSQQQVQALYASLELVEGKSALMERGILLFD